MTVSLSTQNYSLDAVKKSCEDVYPNESYYACAVVSSGTVYFLVQGGFNF